MSHPGILPLTLLGLWGGVSAASGQEHLVSARARVDFAEGDRAHVAITYVVQATPESREVPLAGLLFGDAEISSVQVSIAGTESPVPITHRPGERMRASIPLGITALDEGPISFVLRYEVSGAAPSAGVRELRVPVLAVMWPPAEALPGIFRAELLLAPGLTVLGSFPADLREAEAGGRYVTELPVLPALLSLRVTDGGGRLRVTTILNTAVLVLLGVVLVGGWRYLKGTE
jgi:hypothetical protein